MGARKCLVCNEAVPKYKCPSCLVPYCSLACFKKHKEIPCAKPVSSEEKQKITSVKPVPVEEKLTSDPLLPEVRPCHVDKQKEFLQRSQLESIAADPLLPEEQPHYVDKQSEVLQKSQLESIASSSEVRGALQSEGLRALIYKIDSSPDALNELERAMGEEAFRLFTDKVLSIVSP